MTRKKTERELEEKIEELQEKLGMATATLQQSVGGVSGQLAAQVEKVRGTSTSHLLLGCTQFQVLYLTCCSDSRQICSMPLDSARTHRWRAQSHDR